jgi:proteasome activator subunit 4
MIPQMVFNGPVFLGYPPEQLAIILQNSNLGAAFRGS